MSWLDNYAQRYFKTLRDGRQAFFPYLVFRRGYVVSSEQRVVMRRYMIGAQIFGPLLGVFAGGSRSLGLSMLVIALFFAAYFGGLLWLTRDLERVPIDARPTIGER